MASAFIVRGDDGEDYGPVELGELRQWVRENRAGLGTLVRTDEAGSLWQPWQYHPELVALLAESRAVGPLAGSVLAPLGRRMLALVLDLVLIYILLCLLFFIVYLVFLPDVIARMAVAVGEGIYAAPQLPPSYEAFFGLLIYGVMTLYMAGFHAARGQTPAKALLRLRVVDQNGAKPGLGRALARGLILSLMLGLFFSSLPYGFLIFPLLYVFANPQRRALHDLAAGTYVVES